MKKLGYFGLFIYLLFISCSEERYELVIKKADKNVNAKMLFEEDFIHSLDTTVFEMSSMDDLTNALNSYLSNLGLEFDDEDSLENEPWPIASTTQFLYWGDGIFTDYEPTAKWISVQFSQELAKYINDTHKTFPARPEWNINPKKKYWCKWRYQEIGISLREGELFGPRPNDELCGLKPETKDELDMTKRGYRAISSSKNYRILHTSVLEIVGENWKGGVAYSSYYVPNPYDNHRQGFRYQYAIRNP
jgi:hypothetical protein|nr:MAG TPA: hypothetical protein [Caudoviricetes sp.]